jgi:hypothetical protein
MDIGCTPALMPQNGKLTIMLFTKISYSKCRWHVLILLAVIGGALGFGASARRARALSCVAARPWPIALESTASSDPNVDHRSLWPDRLSLAAPPMSHVPGNDVVLMRNDGSGRYVEAKR